MPKAAAPFFKLYPRGFFGAHLPTRIARTAQMVENNNGFHSETRTVIKDQEGIDASNSHIEMLYAKYMRRAPECTGNRFRESILQAALAAFGSPNFEFWFRSQYESPMAGDTHRKFLEDTLHFLREGRRDMSLENWNALVGANTSGGGVGSFSTEVLEFFGITSGGIHRYSQNTQLIDIIQLWCSQPNGIEDLLGTLHILFGDDKQ